MSEFYRKKIRKLTAIDQFVVSIRINFYEQGVHEASLNTAGSLAEALDAPLAYFYAVIIKLAKMIITI